MTRTAFALLAAVALTAFAPAPFPRRESRSQRESVEVETLIGVWRATELYNTPRKERLDPKQNGVSIITITPKRQWIFGRDGQGATPYDLRTNAATSPAEVDFLNAGSTEPYGRGIIQRKGNTIRIIYNWGAQRPTGWENQQGGYWDITLVRE